MWYRIDVSWKTVVFIVQSGLKLYDCSMAAASLRVCESELKRTQNEVVLGSVDHSTYFALYIILFEHMELLEHRATSTAGITMLFCVVYTRKSLVLSGCRCLFSLILVVNHRKSATLIIKRFASILLFYFVSCLDILVSKVFCIFVWTFVESRKHKAKDKLSSSFFSFLTSSLLVLRKQTLCNNFAVVISP